MYSSLKVTERADSLTFFKPASRGIFANVKANVIYDGGNNETRPVPFYTISFHQFLLDYFTERNKKIKEVGIREN